MSTRLALRIATIALAVAGGVAVLAAIAVGASATLMPGCDGCHLTGEFAAATASSAHATTECASCHGGTTIGSRVEFGAAQVFGMYLRLVTLDPALAATQPAQCEACHADAIASTTESAGLRIAHASCARGRECTACHSTTAHGAALSWPRSTTMEMCFDCHGTDAAPGECDSCHAAKLPKDRVKTGSFQVTHGSTYLKTHGMGSMRTCTPCHGEEKCAGCHGAGVPHPADFIKQHAASAVDKTAQCFSCHLESFCSDCHKTEMPHPIEFRLEHADVVAESGEDMCTRCHDPQDCVQCHLDHVHPVRIEQLESMGVLDSGGDGE